MRITIEATIVGDEDDEARWGETKVRGARQAAALSGGGRCRPSHSCIKEATARSIETGQRPVTVSNDIVLCRKSPPAPRPLHSPAARKGDRSDGPGERARTDHHCAEPPRGEQEDASAATTHSLSRKVCV
ncbi:hypothetical protein CKAH01_07106 [Colletotrichum kahawae]|uniref:Uncharacterized protein n=1 Tax=Colletotrichum kahawae TaxID=34407 RepID=A0AAD9Y7K4_COLKA|nr:hypothetical protein CKAH01_07106 [Colletotrichum kahawae]